MGPNISCNGSTMTFSPFYMGNHTTPFDENMDQSSYTVAENWGFQVNFMVPLDGSIVERCKSIAARQEAKMALDYELVRAKECANLQQKGFMLLPGSRVYHMCSDVIPISAWTKAQAQVLKCKLPPKPWYKPWSKPKEICNMSTLSDKIAKEKAAKAKAPVKKETEKGTRMNQIMRHTLGLFHGQAGSSFWKRYLSENMCVRDADVKKIDHIMDKIKTRHTETSVGRID